MQVWMTLSKVPESSANLLLGGNAFPIGVGLEFGVSLDEEIESDDFGQAFDCLGTCLLIFEMQLDSGMICGRVELWSPERD